MKVTDEQIKKAETVSILDYVNVTRIGQVQNSGSRWCKLVIDGHDSIVVSKERNYFVHNGQLESQFAKGGVINFVRHFENVSFQDAVLKLNSDNFERVSEESMQQAPKREPFVYDETQEVKQTNKLKDYLTGVRHIHPKIVDNLIDKGLIVQNKFGSVVFKWKLFGGATIDALKGLEYLPEDDKFMFVGATVQGTEYNPEKYGKRGTFKQIMTNSKHDYGFNVTIGNPEKVYLFESPIDALSYWTLNYDTLTNARLFSMEGLKEGVRLTLRLESDTYFKENNITEYICVDNDDAGQRFIESLNNNRKYNVLGQSKTLDTAYPNLNVTTEVLLPDKQYKDYNEQLVKSEQKISNQLILSSFNYYLTDNKNTDVVKSFLVDTQHINTSIVDKLIARGYLKEDDNHRAVFLWKNGNDVIGAQTTRMAFAKPNKKQGFNETVLDNSLQHGAFNITFGKNPSRLFVFETPMDLLSFLTLFRHRLETSKLSARFIALNVKDLSKGAYTSLKTIDNYISKSVSHVSFCFSKNIMSEQFMDDMAIIKQEHKQEFRLFNQADPIKLGKNFPKASESWSQELISFYSYNENIQEYEKTFNERYEKTPGIQSIAPQPQPNIEQSVS